MKKIKYFLVKVEYIKKLCARISVDSVNWVCIKLDNSIVFFIFELK